MCNLLRRPCWRALFATGWSALAWAGPAAQAPSGLDAPTPEPRLFRTTLRIEPTQKQVATMPAARAEWKLVPSVAEKLSEILSAGGFSEPLAAALRARLTIIPGTGEGVIRPDAALLDLFRPGERLRWWAVLSSHASNRSYRWPIALRVTELAEMEQEPGFVEAARRIRAWGVPDGPRLFFGDLFALEEAFAGTRTRLDFFQQFISADTSFAKLVASSAETQAVATGADYWEAGIHSRELEPILSAIGRIQGHDRIDLAHLLPRLARSLLYTYPPDFAVAAEPAVENAELAVRFFSADTNPAPRLAHGFSAWLQANCDPVTGPTRACGDIIVYEDPATTRWPFAMVYIADGIVLGRRPTMFGPWELLPEEYIPGLNPRLRGHPPTAWRHRTPGKAGGPDMDPRRWLPPEWPEQPELRELPPGPWGRLWSYDVLLAPSSEMLDRLPEPARKPKWVFYGTDRKEIERAIASVPMPDRTRDDLRKLFARAKPDRKGLITVEPSTQLVLATPAVFRERLFGRLVHGAVAVDYAQEIFIATRAGAARWFPPEMVPEPARSTLLSLVYPRGESLMLSDYGTLYHALPDPAIRRRTLRALFRTPVLLVLLERPRPDEVQGLAEYWHLDREKDVGRLLKSFSGNEEMAYLDIVQLLPPLAREMMNVYLNSPADAPTASCYWTALNFSAEEPDSRLLVTPRKRGQESQVAWEQLRSGYEPIETASRLGDIIAYRRKSDGDLQHVCAYVAADVVFTKNGFGPSAPWCLMHLSAVDALYGQPGVERLAFRPRAESTVD